MAHKKLFKDDPFAYIEGLEFIFPSFSIRAVFIVSVVSPLAVFLGWLHLKRSPAYRSELEVSIEANPYYYKLPPRFLKEAIAPVFLEILKLNLKIINKQPLSEAEINSIAELQKKMEQLASGGYVGQPKRIPI